MNKIILFELNEVPIRILEYYKTMRPKSWIANNFEIFNKYETYSENVGHLSPWNTWPTLHRGVSDEKHFISELNQDLVEVNKAYPAIWDILLQNNISTGIFASLHTYPIPKISEHVKFHIPDVFSPHPDTHPKKIEVFQNINLNLSRKSAKNVDKSIPLSDVLKNATTIASLGFNPATIATVGKQLLGEKLDNWKTTRRRTIQSQLSFDVFYKLLKKDKPDFVTFFTNHVASSMHRYWAATFPNEYENLLFDDEWLKTYTNEIIYTMNVADKMLEKIANFVNSNPEYKLLIASSMGQEAVECEPLETQLSLQDSSKFFKNLGIDSLEDVKELPAMIPQYNFSISEGKRKILSENLKKVKINGKPISFKELDNGYFSITLGQANLKEINIELDEKSYELNEFGFINAEIEDKSGATAYHIPNGHLFVYHPKNKKSVGIETQIATCDIAPIILNNFGVKRPDYMNKVSFEDL